MKRIALILVTLGAVVLAGCSSNSQPFNPPLIQLGSGVVQSDMECEKIMDNGQFAYDIYRCENPEVVCYQNLYAPFADGAAGGISCKWK